MRVLSDAAVVVDDDDEVVAVRSEEKKKKTDVMETWRECWRLCFFPRERKKK